MVDATDLKSVDLNSRVGSSPTTPIRKCQSNLAIKKNFQTSNQANQKPLLILFPCGASQNE